MVLITEPFLDDEMIAHQSNIIQDMIPPKKEKVVFRRDKPWEHKVYYFTVVKDKDTYYMYYRADSNVRPAKEKTCVAISHDGLNFTKPNIGKKRYEKSLRNNIIIDWFPVTHNFCPLKFEDKYLAIGGLDRFSGQYDKGMFLLESNEGLEWYNKGKIFSQNDVLQPEKPIGTCFDSHNVIVYNQCTKQYHIYARYNIEIGIRTVQSSSSKDLVKFSKFQELVFYNKDNSVIRPDRDFSIYTSNITNYPDSSYLIGFPNVQSGNDYQSKYVSLIGSRDGHSWKFLCNKPVLETDQKAPYNAATGLVKSPDSKKFYFYIKDWNSYEVTCYSYQAHRISSRTAHGSGVVKTKVIQLESPKMLVNFRSQNQGNMDIQLYSLDETLIAESKHLQGDHFNFSVDWEMRQNFSSNEKYYLIFKLYNCSLFSYSYDKLFEEC